MPFVWLAVFLMPVNCLQPSNQDINAPIQNIRVDPRRGELSWDLHGNVGEVFCNKSRYRFKAKNNNTACQFHAFSSCMVTNYTIRITKGPSFSTIIRYPTEEGTPGTAAQNLTCRIHDKDFLQCRWGVGWAAPGDVQYHLYLKKDRLPSEVKCPHYTKDPQGRHVACHFNISRFENGFYQIMVNGTSKASRVSCTEIFKYLKDIEVLSPPNITGWCNKSYSFMEWKTPSRLTYDLSYELQIEKSTGPKHVETVHREGNYFTLTNPGTYTVKIRTSSKGQHSAWSSPQSFECDSEERPSARVWRTSLLIVSGTLGALLPAALLCRRYSVVKKLFPPIPKMKDPIRDNLPSDSMMAWDMEKASQEECAVEEVQVVEKL
ncbi:interleukin-3 receptor subunit alpha isoform X3 [Dasypus novemcinctus]|uniref:interleukin-3 receptor subunit alpha isoform X3 n=1 Tax=Dasypus novemcinctus TaxID=9361 RepID=UPI00265FCEF0|nr:interleukin-3 receptor subunit alpha isoform X3 [Dasypus novemcinctus]